MTKLQWFREPTAVEVDVEQCVLGLLLEDAETAWFVLDRIEPDDMLTPLHQRIVEAVRRVLDNGGRPDPINVMAAMASDAELEEVGGAHYFGVIRSKGRNVDIAADLCAALADHAQRRALASEIAETESRLRDNSTPAGDVLADHQAAIQALAEGRARPDDPVSWYEAGTVVVDRISQPDETRPTLLPYGLPPLDSQIGGMGDGDLVIVAGRPGMGKTALAIVIGHAVSRAREQITFDLNETHKPAPAVGVFMVSLEMKHDALLERGLSMRAFMKGKRVTYKQIRLNRVEDWAQQALAEVLVEDTNIPFIIDQRHSQTVGQIGVRARRVQARLRRRGIRLGLTIIDHLGLIEPSTNHGGNRVSEVTQITKDLKNLARSLDMPVMALCQLSRKVEERDDKRPYLSDLRDSGSIEQDADQVLLLYRAEYYLSKSEPRIDRTDDKTEKRTTAIHANWESLLEQSKNKVEIHAAKNRHGNEATVALNCELAYNWIGGKVSTTGEWYKRNPTKFIRGVTGLGPDVIGAYAVILDLIYEDDGSCENDSHWVAGILGCSARKARALMDKLLARDKLYLGNDGCLHNRTADEVLKEAKDGHRPHIPGSLREYIFERDEGRCVYCGAPAEHLDHVTPVCRGGSSVGGNLVAACAPCNHSKGSKLLEEWRQ